MPDGADRILAALARLYGPSDRVGTPEIRGAAGCSEKVAIEARQWAKAAGRWPYRSASPRNPEWGFGSRWDDEIGGGT